MTDREHAVKALAQMIRANEQKASQCKELAIWFRGLNQDLNKAVQHLKKGA